VKISPKRFKQILNEELRSILDESELDNVISFRPLITKEELGHIIESLEDEIESLEEAVASHEEEESDEYEYEMSKGEKEKMQELEQQLENAVALQSIIEDEKFYAQGDEEHLKLNSQVHKDSYERSVSKDGSQSEKDREAVLNKIYALNAEDQKKFSALSALKKAEKRWKMD